MRSTQGVLAILVLLSAVFLLHACKDDGVTGTGSAASRMDLLWPNEDGNEWQFDMNVNWWNTSSGEAIYPSADLVPPMPSLDELLQRLEASIAGDPVTSTELTFRMVFDGMAQTASGVTGQNLHETVGRLPAKGKSVQGSHREIFFSRLLRARPDLQERVNEICPELIEDSAALTAASPIFLHGGVFEKTREYVGTYGDLNSLLAWKWLEANVSEGHEFVFQLVPSLADDVLLHARILGERRIHVPAGLFPRTVMVLYALDFGVSEAVDSDGNTQGAFRAYSFGEIGFAAGVGPIWSHEQMIWPVLGPDSSNLEEYMIELQPQPALLLDVPVQE